MDTKDCIKLLNTLGQETRMEAFKLLLKHEPIGLAAGEVARQLGHPQNSVSMQLKLLSDANLVITKRDGRSIIYRSNTEKLSELIKYLASECCLDGKCGLPFSENQNTEIEKMKKFKILFVCTSNSARSIIAESICNNEFGDLFEAYSAGSNPKGTVSEGALKLLANLGYDISELYSKSWDVINHKAEFDFVFTICDRAAKEVCPAWTGSPITSIWAVPSIPENASDVERSLAYGKIYRMLHTRIGLLASLPISKLDDASLQHEVDEIGKQ